MNEEAVATIVPVAVALAVAIHRLLRGPLLDPAFEVLVIYLPAVMAVVNFINKRLRHGVAEASASKH